MSIRTIYPKERTRPCQPLRRSPAQPDRYNDHTRALSTSRTPSAPLRLRPARQRQRANDLVAALLIIVLAAICVTALLTVPIITG